MSPDDACKPSCFSLCRIRATNHKAGPLAEECISWRLMLCYSPFEPESRSKANACAPWLGSFSWGLVVNGICMPTSLASPITLLLDHSRLMALKTEEAADPTIQLPGSEHINCVITCPSQLARVLILSLVDAWHQS